MVFDSFSKISRNMVAVKENLIDMACVDPKPIELLSNLWGLKQGFSGMNSHDKVGYVRLKMKEHGCDCYVLTALDEIAWLLNSISLSFVADRSSWK